MLNSIYNLTVLILNEKRVSKARSSKSGHHSVDCTTDVYSVPNLIEDNKFKSYAAE